MKSGQTIIVKRQGIEHGQSCDSSRMQSFQIIMRQKQDVQIVLKQEGVGRHSVQEVIADV